MSGDGLGWVAAAYPEGFCLTFARGLNDTTCLTRLGADLSPAVGRTRDEAARLDATLEGGYGPIARAGQAGGWAYTIEAVSYEGTRAEVARKVSAGTCSVCVFCDIEGHAGLVYAEDGVVLARLEDHLLDAAGRTGSEPGWLLSALAQVDADGIEEELGPAGPPLELAQAVFCLGLDEAVVEEQELLSGRVIALLDELSAGQPAIGDYGADVDAAVAAADETSLRSALAHQARRMAAESGVDRYPEVAEALRECAGGGEVGVDDQSPLGRLVRVLKWEKRVADCARLDPDVRARPVAAESDERRHRYEAARALRVARSLPPLHGLGAVVDVRARWGSSSWLDELLAGLS